MRGYRTGQFDAICLERLLADEVASRFDVEMLPVGWPRASPGGAMQIVVPSVGEAWFDPDELRERTTARHGRPGARCPECGTWRWLPLAIDALPPLRVGDELDDHDVAASPEWFGDGATAFREILVRRELAELIVAASPKDFRTRDWP